MTQNSLINLGELSKPATVLIERISDAIGAVYRPRQIRLIAEAEADADKTRAVAQIQISEMQRRSISRMINEEVIKQENMERIVSESIPQVLENANPQDIEKDWIANFFDKCRLTSDEEMQKLWSRLLAGEANAPGKFSKRTINTFSSLDMRDAVLFSQLVNFGWDVFGLTPLIFDLKDQIYGDNGVSFIGLKHLEDIGLIRFEALTGFSNTKLPQLINIRYQGRSTFLKFKNESDNTLNIGHVMLTGAGQEISTICERKYINGLEEYVRSKWSSQCTVIEMNNLSGHVTIPKL